MTMHSNLEELSSYMSVNMYLGTVSLHIYLHARHHSTIRFMRSLYMSNKAH